MINSVDTPQQRAVLRQCAAARRLRKLMPAATRVVSVAGEYGTVLRHVPGTDAQGGYLTIQWDNGNVGRHSPFGIKTLQEASHDA